MEYTYLTHSDVYSSDVYRLQTQLVRYGYLDTNSINGYFDLNTEKAFRSYQTAAGLVPDGKFNSDGFTISDESIHDNPGVVTMLSRSGENSSSDTVDEDRNAPFFNDSKSYVFRKGTIDILVEYANSTKQRRKIENVKIRSMSQVIDTSGQVIADVYQFVARDIIEYNK